MRILGTNFFGHDSSIFMIDTSAQDLFAMSTERVTRIKHDGLDISAILEEYGLRPIDHISHGYAATEGSYEGVSAAALRLPGLYRRIARPRFVADLRRGRWQKLWLLLGALPKQPIDVIRFFSLKTRISLGAQPVFDDCELRKYILATLGGHGIDAACVSLWDHHLCHAASAYYFSPFVDHGRTVVLSLDEYGDGHFSKAFVFEGMKWELVSASKGVRLDILHAVPVASIGFIYSNFTEALGLIGGTDEGKVEALAAFGVPDPVLARALRGCVRVNAHGFEFDAALAKPFYDKRWLRRELLRIGDRNFAATVQRWLENIVVEHLNLLHHKLNQPQLNALCLAGGVCANVIMTLNIFERTPFKEIYIFPAMGDEGVAAGAAVLTAVRLGEEISWLRGKYMPYFGNRVSLREIERAIKGYPSIRAMHLESGWQAGAAEAIAQGKIIGLVQGRMEFGPRALGNRSILANPTRPDARDRLNASIKRRPWYQPFCPSILEEERHRLFESSFPHKHMAVAFRMRKEYWGLLPSAIHVDGTVRPQFVEEADNPPYYRLLKEIQKRTGFGVVINTSLNLHGRTIARTATDAIDDFLASNMDELYIEGFRITRKPSR